MQVGPGAQPILASRDVGGGGILFHGSINSSSSLSNSILIRAVNFYMPHS